jgi:hypothetical protein
LLRLIVRRWSWSSQLHWAIGSYLYLLRDVPIREPNFWVHWSATLTLPTFVSFEGSSYLVAVIGIGMAAKRNLAAPIPRINAISLKVEALG